LGGCGRRNTRAGRQAEELARLGGEAAADDQVDAPAGAHFVEQHLALELELGDGGAVLGDLAVVGQHLDDVAHLQLAHVDLDRQRARVFLRVEEDRRDLAAQRDAAEALVRHEGMSWPVAQITLLVALLRLEPVPTTSPT
jgi:hypothetical protein